MATAIATKADCKSVRALRDSTQNPGRTLPLEKKFKINTSTITTTYNPHRGNRPKSLKKKVLDNRENFWYNGNIIIEMKKKMNERFKTGDMIQIGSRKENVALVLGPAFPSEVEGGMWWVQRVETGKPIMIFQSQIIKVIS